MKINFLGLPCGLESDRFVRLYFRIFVLLQLGQLLDIIVRRQKRKEAVLICNEESVSSVPCVFGAFRGLLNGMWPECKDELLAYVLLLIS